MLFFSMGGSPLHLSEFVVPLIAVFCAGAPFQKWNAKPN
jgi:hypothetical protein